MDWQMLTLVGEDQPGIVARVTDALFRGGCNLGEASMIRLGGNFTIMLMVRGEANVLSSLVAPVADKLNLRFHLDPIHGVLHQHPSPNFQVRVVGADRAGIVSQVTGVLAQSGFNILELESDVVGSDDAPVYIMTIQGYAETALETLESALGEMDDGEIEVNISPIETLIG
jgi:glycine cleavage system transcriptional repressor